MPNFDQVSPLRIDREVRQNCQIFRLNGIFDAFSEPTFRSVLEKSIGESSGDVLLDLTGVHLMDSLALGALVDLGQKIQKNGGTLQTVGSPRVTQVIKSIRLEQLLSIQPSVDVAIENLEKESRKV